MAGAYVVYIITKDERVDFSRSPTRRGKRQILFTDFWEIRNPVPGSENKHL